MLDKQRKTITIASGILAFFLIFIFVFFTSFYDTNKERILSDEGSEKDQSISNEIQIVLPDKEVVNISNSKHVENIDLDTIRHDCSALITDDSILDKEYTFGVERLWPNPNQSSDDCRNSLKTFYAEKPVSEYIMPMPILTWRDIFDNIDTKIGTVITTLQNQQCKVPQGSLRFDYQDTCNARAMVEIAILMESCASVNNNTRAITATMGGNIDSPPTYNKYSHYRSNYDKTKRDTDLRRLEDLKGSSLNYWHELDTVDNSYFRSAYLRMECNANKHFISELFNEHEETKTTSHPTNLWELASRYGNPIALSSYVPRESDAMTLMLSNPIQTSIQFAKDSEISHNNFRLHKLKWNSDLRNTESSVLAGIADLSTFRNFLKEENIKCPNNCGFEDMSILFDSLNSNQVTRWNQFFTTAQVYKLPNDRVYWGLVAEGLAKHFNVKIDVEQLYERFISNTYQKLTSSDRAMIQSLADEKVVEIVRLRERTFRKGP